MIQITIQQDYKVGNLTTYLQQQGIGVSGVQRQTDESDNFVAIIIDVETSQEAATLTALAGYNDNYVYDQRAREMAEMKAAAAAEIVFLNTTIPTVDAMTNVQVRGLVKRLCQENLAIIKAIKWLVTNGQ